MKISKLGHLLMLLALAISLSAEAQDNKEDNELYIRMFYLTESRPRSELDALERVQDYLYRSQGTLHPKTLVINLYQMAPKLAPQTIPMLLSLNTIYNAETSTMVTEDFQGDLYRGERALTTGPSAAEVRARFISLIADSNFTSKNLVRRLIQWYLETQDPAIIKLFQWSTHDKSLEQMEVPKRFVELLMSNAETSANSEDAIYLLWKLKLTPKTHGFLAAKALRLLRSKSNANLIGIWSKTVGEIDTIPYEIDVVLKGSPAELQEAAIWALAKNLRDQNLLQDKIIEMWNRPSREADIALAVMVASIRNPRPSVTSIIANVVSKKEFEYYASTVFMYLEERRKFVVNGKADPFTRFILSKALASGLVASQNEGLRTVYRLGLNEPEFVARALLLSQSREDYAAEAILKKAGFKFRGETFDRSASGNLHLAIELANSLNGPIASSLNALIAFWRQELQEARAAQTATRTPEPPGSCQFITK